MKLTSCHVCSLWSDLKYSTTEIKERGICTESIFLTKSCCYCGSPGSALRGVFIEQVTTTTLIDTNMADANELFN